MIPVVLLLLVSCGLPQDEYVIFSNLVEYPNRILTEETISVIVTNVVESQGSRDPYDPTRVKGYNFFYRYYSEDEYIKLAGGADLFNDTIIQTMLSEAKNKLTKPNQIKFSESDSLTAINTISRPYYQFGSKSLDSNGIAIEPASPDSVFTAINFPATTADFYEGNDFAEVEYQFQVPTREVPYPRVVKYRRNSKVLLDAEKESIQLYRRVYDPLNNELQEKNFYTIEYTQEGSSELVLPDEDIASKEISKDTSVFYVAYFVALTGTQVTPTIKQLKSEVSFIAVQKFTAIDMQQNLLD